MRSICKENKYNQDFLSYHRGFAVVTLVYRKLLHPDCCLDLAVWIHIVKEFDKEAMLYLIHSGQTHSLYVIFKPAVTHFNCLSSMWMVTYSWGFSCKLQCTVPRKYCEKNRCKSMLYFMLMFYSIFNSTYSYNEHLWENKYEAIWVNILTHMQWCWQRCVFCKKYTGM